MNRFTRKSIPGNGNSICKGFEARKRQHTWQDPKEGYSDGGWAIVMEEESGEK